jgi:hypothetical protein
MENTIIRSDFNLSKPLYIELINTRTNNGFHLEFEFELSFKSEKWIIRRYLSEIKTFIKCLAHLKYTFLPTGYVRNLDEDESASREVITTITDILKYITYRHDILSNAVAKEFFQIKSDDFAHTVEKDNLEHIYTFKVEEGDMTMSDFYYDPIFGILIVTLEDLSFYSRIGRFWSLIDYEILGNILIYQRKYDNNKRPYFTKLIAKNFDTRISRVEVSHKYNRIFVGMENGALQLFNINQIDTSQFKTEPIITINEGKLCKYTNEKITALCEFGEYLFIMSKENKLHIIHINTYESKFVGNLKKRMEGKGHISRMYIEPGLKKLILCTVTNKFFIYDIKIGCDYIDIDKEEDLDSETFEIHLKGDKNNTNNNTDIKIEYYNEYDLDSNIRNIFMRNITIFIALETSMVIFNLKNDERSGIDFKVENGISVSSKFFKLDYSCFITALSFFIDMKLIILGLNTGTLVALSSRSLEVIFARKISEHQICKLILLEDNYIVIAGDEKGNVYFFKFGN